MIATDGVGDAAVLFLQGGKRGGQVRKGRINILEKLSATQRVVRAGQTIDIRVTRRHYIGKVLQVKFRAGKNP